jgi:hypothetical protein
MAPAEFKWSMFLMEESTAEGQFFNRKIQELGNLVKVEKSVYAMATETIEKRLFC